MIISRMMIPCLLLLPSLPRQLGPVLFVPCLHLFVFLFSAVIILLVCVCVSVFERVGEVREKEMKEIMKKWNGRGEEKRNGNETGEKREGRGDRKRKH